MKRASRILRLVLIASICAGTWMAQEAVALPESQGAATVASSNSAGTVSAAAQPTAVLQAGERKTPWYKSRKAKIIGGGTGAGAVIGGLAGGGKGAAIGAISGGAAGYIYERKTSKKK